LVKKVSRIEVYNALAMEAKFWPLEKMIKTIDIKRDEISQKNSQVHPFGPQRNEEILEVLKTEPGDSNLRRYK